MNSLNSIILEGNLVRDPELKETGKGKKLCTFTVASNRFFKLGDEYQKEVSYFDITTWERLAEVCAEYLKKGRGVRITGRLKQDQWKNQDGTGRSRVYIIADQVEFKPQPKTETSQNTDDDIAGEVF